MEPVKYPASLLLIIHLAVIAFKIIFVTIAIHYHLPAGYNHLYKLAEELTKPYRQIISGVVLK